MKEEKTYREPDVQPDDDVIVIDWMGLVRRAWNCRRLLLKAMGVGLVLGCVVALSIPKKYTVNVTLSPESGQVGGNLSGLASMVGLGGMQMDGEDALGAALSGDIVGLDGLAGMVYSSDLIALEDTEVCILPYDKLLEVTQNMFSMSQHFQKLLAMEIVRQNGVMLLLGSMHAEERLAAFILNLSQRFEQRGYSRSEFVLRMTRAEIGSYLGLKLETVSRVLSRFSHDNLIIVNQKHVQIMDFEGLRAIVSGQAYSHENPGLHRIEPVAHRGVDDLVGLED